MRVSGSRRLTAIALCLPLAVVPTAGCAAARDAVLGKKFAFHCPQPAQPGLAIAVGARANSPAPTPPAEVRKMIVASMTGCGKVTVVRVDGRPSIAGAVVFSSTAKTEQNHGLEQDAFLKKVNTLFTEAKALSAEANILGALSVASGAAGPGGTVVLIDSGVQTTDPMDLRKNNLPKKKPRAIVEALRRGRLLPNLGDRKVIVAGLGYTAAPQSALDEHSRDFLVELWREIMRASGAEDPVILPEPNTAASLVTNPSVSVVDFPIGAIQVGCNALAVLPDNGDVGFIPDQAEFKNPQAARAVLKRFADFLNTNAGARVEIEGFVAHYGHGDLSQRRADRVKRELVSLGVGSPISAKGMGWGPYPDPSAPPDPRYDQLNRQVTIAVKCD